jgi:uncharacterized protein (TIGR02246 family)
MKLPLYVLTTALVLAASTPGVLAAASNDETAVRDHCATFVAAWNHHDPKAMAATWAEDGNLINPSGRIAANRAEVEKLLTDEHSTFMRGTTYATPTITVRFVAPTVAVTDWTSEITGMHDPKGAELPVFKHRVVAVMVKKDGKWSTAMVRAYADLPPPPPPAAATP